MEVAVSDVNSNRASINFALFNCNGNGRMMIYAGDGDEVRLKPFAGLTTGGTFYMPPRCTKK